jgi:hypothetical protein
MQSAKSLGFKKGDFVVTSNGQGFPGIITGDAHTSTPQIEVWGIAHEIGSEYADRLQKLSWVNFLQCAHEYDFDGTAYTSVAKKAIQDAKAAFEKLTPTEG